MNGADVRVIQGGGGFGFALETAQGLGIFRNIIRQKFEGYEAAKLDVFGFVDYAHASAAQFFEDAVMRNGLVQQVIWASGMECYQPAKRKATPEAWAPSLARLDSGAAVPT